MILTSTRTDRNGVVTRILREDIAGYGDRIIKGIRDSMTCTGVDKARQVATYAAPKLGGGVVTVQLKKQNTNTTRLVREHYSANNELIGKDVVYLNNRAR